MLNLPTHNTKELFDKREVTFLFKSFFDACEIQAGLWIVDQTKQVLVNYPLHKELGEMRSGFDECFKTKSPRRDKDYIYSPIVVGEKCMGVLIGEVNEKDNYRLTNILKSINNLLVKLLYSKIEKRALLQKTLVTNEEVRLVQKIEDKINACFDIKHLAHIILLEAKKVISCDNASLMLINENDKRLEIAVGLGDKAENMSFNMGEGIAGIVAKSGTLIISNEVAKDKRFIPGRLKLNSLLCAPLKVKQKLLGVINLSNKQAGIFNDQDAGLLELLATQAAHSIENAIFYEQRLNEDRLVRNLERYLSPHLVKELMENKHDLHLGGVKKNVVVLFADIRSFTSLSEELTPEQVVAFLNEYFTKMVDVIFKHGGMIDKFVGDEIMAIFGAPITCQDDAERAIQTAIEMQKATEECKPQGLNGNYNALSIGIGINSGEVIAGNIGSKKHMDYTVIGDAVNTAKRLESYAQKNQILVTRDVFNMVAKSKHQFKEIGKVKVKGKKQLLEVLEVVY